jgi:hypothetical protein
VGAVSPFKAEEDDARMGAEDPADRARRGRSDSAAGRPGRRRARPLLRRHRGAELEGGGRLLSERGWFRPFWLELDGRPIAFIYGFVFGDTYWAIKTSYDRAHAALAPGTALFHEAVRDAFRCGLRRFDFVGHDARWTKEWATGRIRHYDIGLYPVSPSGAAAYVRDRYWRPGLRSLGLGRREGT